jgi:pyridoxine kinase
VNLLSIQSHVAFGHVGNSAAVFPLQRIGVDVWPIHTVQFSNHTGYGACKGEVFGPALIRDIVQGIEERGALGECDGVISGYLGSAEIGQAILDAVTRTKQANPAARYCCDPVIGDVGRGIFVQPGVAEFIKECAVPAADLVTPNQFELGYLAGLPTSTRAEVLAAIDAVHALGPRIVLVTSLHTRETPRGSMDLMACDRSGRFLLRTPELPISPHGAGDAIAGLFFATHLRTGSLADALSLSASAIYGVLSRTAETGSRELMLVEAQDEFVTPNEMFSAQPIDR